MSNPTTDEVRRVMSSMGHKRWRKKSKKARTEFARTMAIRRAIKEGWKMSAESKAFAELHGITK